MNRATRVFLTLAVNKLNMTFGLGSRLFAMMFICICIFSCGGSGDNDGGASNSGSKTYKDQVIVHNLSDPEGLHPQCTSDASATEIKRYMFQKLLDYNHEDLQLIPVLAKELPKMELTADGKGMKIVYEIRPEAQWEDGKPVTAKDVEFSFKAVKNPKVDAASIRPYIEFIEDFQIDPENPKKFTLICDAINFLWDHVTGFDVTIGAKHIYDPQGLSDKFTFKEIARGGKKIHDAPENIAFAKEFNGTKYQRRTISGSGPYKFVSWETDRKIIMERKKDWWGDKIKGTNMYYADGPQTVIYETVNDQTTAITAMKGGKLDVMKSIPPKNWTELPKSEKFMKNYAMHDPQSLIYSYVGLHIREPKFQDKRTRQAIAHLIDVEQINENINYGLEKRIVGPISPSFPKDYHKGLSLYKYDLEKAKQLLKEAGWSDSNGNGLLDMKIDGKLQDFEITFNYNQGNDIRKNVGLAFQETARQAGIKVEVIPMEWSVFLEKLKQHEVEMWYGAWVMDPRPSDPKQIWHTDSYNGGSNYTGFGNAETDALIESITSELDPVKRSKLYMKWQEILHEEVPYVFMFNRGMRIAIHNRFSNLGLSSRDPGHYPGGFSVPASGATANH